MKSTLEGEPASRSRYSMVKYEMQTASTSASLGLSTGSPFTSLDCIQGKVLRHMPRVEMSTSPMESSEIILAQNEDCGFSNRSHSALGTQGQLDNNTTTSQPLVLNKVAVSKIFNNFFRGLL